MPGHCLYECSASYEIFVRGSTISFTSTRGSFLGSSGHICNCRNGSATIASDRRLSGSFDAGCFPEVSFSGQWSTDGAMSIEAQVPAYGIRCTGTYNFIPHPVGVPSAWPEYRNRSCGSDDIIATWYSSAAGAVAACEDGTECKSIYSLCGDSGWGTCKSEEGVEVSEVSDATCVLYKSFDPCAARDCGSHGQCVAVAGYSICQCDDGYYTKVNGDGTAGDACGEFDACNGCAPRAARDTCDHACTSKVNDDGTASVPAGYNPPMETNLNIALGAFDVGATCEEGYVGTPTVTPCSGDDEAYTLDGSCVRPGCIVQVGHYYACAGIEGTTCTYTTERWDEDQLGASIEGGGGIAYSFKAAVEVSRTSGTRTSADFSLHGGTCQVRVLHVTDDYTEDGCAASKYSRPSNVDLTNKMCTVSGQLADISSQLGSLEELEECSDSQINAFITGCAFDLSHLDDDPQAAGATAVPTPSPPEDPDSSSATAPALCLAQATRACVLLMLVWAGYG
eukprot:COSAG04_NODE_1175_length_7925_cov_11.243965_5_plen_508_part_00